MKEKILQELPEKRGKFTKHFQMERKGMAAAVYPVPVHYEEDGELKEIDNRLEYCQEESKEVYRNKASDVHVSFAKSAYNEELVSIEKDGHTISWGFAPVKQEKRLRSNLNTNIKKEFQVLGQEETLQAAMTAEEVPVQQEEETREEEIKRLMSVPHIKGEGVYEDIVTDLDLHYVVQGDRIKEDITLKSKTAACLPLSFTLSHPGLIPCRREDGGYGLYRELKEDGTPKEETFVYEFVKPFMYDAKGNRSEKVQLTVETIGEGESLLTICPDHEWLMAEERVYPVVIDPMTETTKTPNNIADTFVSSGYSGSVYGNGSFVVGKSDEYGMSRALLKFKTLPAISKGSIIYAAKMYLWQSDYSTYGLDKVTLEAHAIEADWNESSVRWSSQPSWKSDVLDFQKAGDPGNNIVPIGFDVTKLARQWYAAPASKNYGIMVRSRQESDTALANKAYVTFLSSDYPGAPSDVFPSGVFYYRNVNGLEDYLSYHEQSAGRAGTGYINDYTGNVVWIHPDAETEVGPMPAGLSHVYNLSEADTLTPAGYGWRLSAMQQLMPTGITDFPYAYIDEDGTKHFFFKDKEDGDKLKDEDGLGLTLTQTNGSNYDQKYVMETKDKMKLSFAGDTYLREELDLDGNRITYAYTDYNGTHYLHTITDATGLQLKLEYTADKKRLTGILDAKGRRTSFTYDNYGNLSNVIYPDGKKSVFFANTSHQLLAIRNIDNYKMEYNYANDYQVPRVKEVYEVGQDAGPGTTPGKKGQVLRITYQNGNTTIFEEPGQDGSIDNKGDNRSITYHFDTTGRPTDVMDDDGYANSYTYYSEGMKNNKLSKSGSTQKTVYGLLKNPCFDPKHEAGDGWTPYSDTSQTSGFTVTRVAEPTNLGTRCIKIYKTQTDMAAGVRQAVTLNAGTYTLSAYVKTKSSSAAGIAIQKTDGYYVARSRNITYVTDSQVDDGWERLSLSFTLNSQTQVYALGAMFGGTGTVYFTGFQLEEGSVANKVNLVNNPGFRKIEGGKPIGWTYSSNVTGNYYEYIAGRNNCAKLVGEIGQQRYLRQTLTLKGGENHIYSISGWARGAGIPEKPFKLTATVVYDDNTEKHHDFAFNSGIDDWQFVSGVFSTNDMDTNKVRTYKEIRLTLYFEDQANQVVFDGIQLIRDDGESYVYDDEGNLVSAKSAAEKSSFTQDDHDNVTKMGNIDGTSFESAYDAKNHVTIAKNTEGVRYTFTYGAKGNPHSSTAQGGRYLNAVTAGRTYYIREKTSGNYMEVKNASTSSQAIVQLNDFNGQTNQRWKVEETKDGYFQFTPQNATGLRLDLRNGSDTDRATIEVYTANNSDAQKWKIRPMDKGGYQISCKATKNKRGLTNVGRVTDNNHPVQNYLLNDDYANQQWYFVPAEDGAYSNLPEDGKIYNFRVVHSGQYLKVDKIGSAEAIPAGSPLQANYYDGLALQQFKLEKYDSQYFYIHPVDAPNLVLAKGSTDAEGYYQLVLATKVSGSASQLFRFVSYNLERYYRIECKDGARSLDVKKISYTPGTSIILTPEAAGVNPGDNKLWYLEGVSERIITTMSYDSDSRSVAQVKDPRGYITHHRYDSKKQLLLNTTDPKGGKTFYTYDSNTDQQLSIGATIGGKDVTLVEYAYDQDRLKSLTHNGIEYKHTYDDYGNEASVSIAGTVMERTEYKPNNGLVDKTIYANGYGWRYEYDDSDLMTKQYCIGTNGRDQLTYVNTYDNYGNVIIHEDKLTHTTYNYIYDLIDRILGVDTSEGQKMRTSYDDKNRLKTMTHMVKGDGYQMEVLYGEPKDLRSPGLTYGLKLNGAEKVRYSYDDLARMNHRMIKLSGTKNLDTKYTFVKGWKDGTTTTLIESMTEGGKTYYYTYDELGNIETIKEQSSPTGSKILKATYYYDELNQLVREDNKWVGKTITYTYDLGGNMTQKKEYAYTTSESLQYKTVNRTVTYHYRSTGWKDQLTSVSYSDGTTETITYDVMGNAKSYRGRNLSWIRGKELTGMVTPENLSLFFLYNSDGIRTVKNVHGKVTNYYLNNSTIMTQIDGDGRRLDFLYDEHGRLFGFEYNGKTYCYRRNIQGDILGVIDPNGTEIATYEYDTWGKLLGISGSSAGDIGKLNPFRYRGYYYDEESGFYYLNSRYYDPEVGRFVNADEYTSTGQGVLGNNMYAYAHNNPVNCVDPSGKLGLGATLVLIGAVSGGLIGGAIGALGAMSDGNSAVEGFVSGAISGAATGALSAAISNPILAGVVTGAANAIADFGSQVYSAHQNNTKFEWNVGSTLTALGSGAIGGVMGSKIGSSKVFTAAENKIIAATGGTVANMGVGTTDLAVKSLTKTNKSNVKSKSKPKGFVKKKVKKVQKVVKRIYKSAKRIVNYFKRKKKRRR